MSRRNFSEQHGRHSLALKAATHPAQLDNHFYDRIALLARYGYLSPQHANAHANANLRLRAAVSGEANDLTIHL
jgi:hypothetical protein